ncbi:hypothetical protein ACR3I8_09940 [Priestia flexa]
MSVKKRGNYYDKKLLNSILGSKKHHRYSSSDYHRRPRHYSSSDYKKGRHYDSRSHSKYGHHHYKRKKKSFFSSFSSS